MAPSWLALPCEAADAIRGSYLAILGDCAGCHTRAHGPAFAGGLPFHAQFGTVYSTNITPDRETGIGNWTGEQFYRALHEGIAPGGRHLYPAFPYIYFSRVSRRDTDDLFAYLTTLKPVHQPATPNRLAFPFNLRWGLALWNWLYFKRNAPGAGSAGNAAWRRGEYLVNGLGHCAGCHTPKNVLFGDETDRALSGGIADGWYAANLTGSMTDGLGKWSRKELAQYLATGRNRYATAAGNMQEKVTLSTSHMSPEDRLAIATYLKGLPPISRKGQEMPDAQQMMRGQAVFAQGCQTCHAPPGQPSPGRLPDYPKFAGDTLLLGRDPTTVIRIILEGAQSPETPNERTTYSMPAFPVLSDEQVADVATYIRNSWGNHAPPVSARQVSGLRAALVAAQ
ncbi:MAG TPA: cytochrome c [Rhizomicrobium sp.]|nr:cytochrome c [Rhizomicrobium sp.]